MPFQSRVTDSIARTMLDRGRSAAEAKYRSGQIWASGITNIGQLARATVADFRRGREEAPERAYRDELRARQRKGWEAEDAEVGRAAMARDEMRAATDPTTGRLDTATAASHVTQIDPVRGLEFWKLADAEQKAEVEKDKDRAARISQWAGALRGLPEDQRAAFYASGRADLIANKVASDDQIPEQYDQAWVTKTHLEALDVVKQLEALKGEPKKTREIKWTKPDGTEVTEVVEDVPGVTRESMPTPPPNIDAAIYGAWRTGDTVK